ncbi:uncharacterized protein LOC124291537 [Haliotis rubra]|uniref:uncharacterized protein LOC124291537 n=1 Tax=Haliotis rubra TaxID=36100 RepID=UPI001EE5AED6|nr:uncharacterized protein LOC124291537 [Haliotis rubra]
MSAWGPMHPVPLGASPQHTCLSSDVERTHRDPHQQGEEDFAEEGYCLYPESQVMAVPSSNTEIATSDCHSSTFLSHSNHSTGSNVFLSGGSGGDLFLSHGESSVEEGRYFSSPGTASLASCEDVGRDGSWSPAFVHTAQVTSRVSSSDISDVSSIYALSPSSENAAILSTSERDEDGHAEPDKAPDCYTCMGESLTEGSSIQEGQTETGSSFHSLRSNISSIIEERQRFQDSDNWPPCLSLSLSFCDTSSVDEICDFESIVPQDDDDILSLSELCANSEETHIVTFNGESQRRSSMLVDRPDRTFYPLQDKVSSQSIETALDKPSDEASSEDQDLVKVEHTGKRVDLCQTLSEEKCVSFVSSNVADTETHQPRRVELGPISYDLNTSMTMPNKKEILFASDDNTRCQLIEESLLYSSTQSSPHTSDIVSPHTSYSGGFKSSLQPQLSNVIIDHVARELAKTAIAVSLRETANEFQRNMFNVMLHPMDERGANYKTSLSEQKLGANEEHKTSIEDSIGLAKPPLKSSWMKNVIKKFEPWYDFKSCIDIASTIGETRGEKVEQAVDANEGNCSEKNKVALNKPCKDRLIPAVQQSQCIKHPEQRSFNGFSSHNDNRGVKVSLAADENGAAEVNWHPKVQYPVCITETQIAQQLQDKTDCVLPATNHNMQSESQYYDVDEKSETFETDSETGCRKCVLQPTSPLCMPAKPSKAEPLVNSEHQHSYHRKLRDACHAEQKRILAIHSSPNTILCEIDGKVGHPKTFATYERLVPTEGNCGELSGSEDCNVVKVGSSKQKNSFWKRKSKNKACLKGEQNNFFNNIGSQKGLMEYAVYILPNNILEQQNSATNHSSVFAEEKSDQLSHNLSGGADRKIVEIANNKKAKNKKKQRPPKPYKGPVEKCGDPQSVMSRFNDNAVQVHSGKWNKKSISKKMPSSDITSTASGTVNESKLPKGRWCNTGIRDLSVIKRATDEHLCQIVAQYTKNYITEVLTGITSLAEKGTGHRQALSKKGQLSNRKRLQTDLREDMGDSTFFDPSHQSNVSDEHSVEGNIPLELSEECKVMKEAGGNTDSKELQTAKSIPPLTSTSTIAKPETTAYSGSNAETNCPNDRLIHNTASAFVAALVLSGKYEQLAHKVLYRAEQEMATYMMHCRKQQMSMSSSKPLPAAHYSGSEIRERVTAAAHSLIQKAFGQLQIKLEEIGLTGKNSRQKQDSMYKLEAYEIATGCILGAMHDNSLEKACPMPELWLSHTSSSNIRKVTNSTIAICSSKPHTTDHISQTYVASQLPTQLRSYVHSHPPTSDVSQSLHPQGGASSVSAKDHDVHTRPMCPFPRHPDTDYERYKMLVEPSKYPLRSSCGQHESDIDECDLAENQGRSMEEIPCVDQNNTKPLQERYASQYYSRRIQCALCKKQQ